MRTHDTEEVVARRPMRPGRGAGAVHTALGPALRAGNLSALGPAGVLRLQRLAGNASVAAMIQARREEDEERSPVKDVVEGNGGVPLDKDVRTDMEGHFGHDFGDVRVHTDAQAAESALAVQAHAYTVGSHIVFQSGEYSPETTSGKRMLAHELTHVVQQRSGPVDGTPAPGGIKVSDPSDSFEQAAEAQADRAVAASGPASAGSSVQRQEVDEVEGDEEEGDDSVQGFFVQRDGDEDVAPAGPEVIEVESDDRAPTSGVGPPPEGEREEAPVVQRHRIPTDRVGPPPPNEREESASDRAVQRVGDAAGTVVVYPSYSDITGSSIGGEASTAWQETLDATVDGSRREQGFWVRWNKDTSTYAVAGRVVAPTVNNATGASVDLGAKPGDTATNFTVGSFHTHTPTRYRTVGRPIGPSAADQRVDTSDNVAGLVYDYISPDGSGNIPAGHALRSPAKLWSSGPNRRA